MSTAQATEGQAKQVTLGSIVRTPAGRTATIIHPYTNDAGEQWAFVKFEDGRKGQFAFAELRPVGQAATPRHLPRARAW